MCASEILESACTQVAGRDPADEAPAAGAAVVLPRGEGEGAAGIAAWARRLAACAETRALRAEIGHWLGQGEEQGEGHGKADAARLPCDHAPDRPETVAEGEEELLVLSEEETTALLGRAQAAYRTQANDLLLAALVRAVGRWREEAGAGDEAGRGAGGGAEDGGACEGGPGVGRAAREGRRAALGRARGEAGRARGGEGLRRPRGQALRRAHQRDGGVHAPLLRRAGGRARSPG